MTDCLDVYLKEKTSVFFADPVLLALFLVELFWFLALRGRRTGTLAFYMLQYVSTLLLYVLVYTVMMMYNSTLVYDPRLIDCLMAYERRFGWIIRLGFVIPILGLAITSYATCVLLEDRPCKILIPVILLRTPMAASLTAYFIWGLI